MKVKAILFGATGMVGEGVLRVALDHADVETVLVIGRRSCGVSHPKLREIVHGDFYDFSAIESQCAGYNACFFCLGVSSVGMKEAEYRRVTYDLTIAAAHMLARQNPAHDVLLCLRGWYRQLGERTSHVGAGQRGKQRMISGRCASRECICSDRDSSSRSPDRRTPIPLRISRLGVSALEEVSSPVCVHS